MENQNNYFSHSKKLVILLIVGAAVLLVIMFFLFFFANLEKRGAILEKTTNTPPASDSVPADKTVSETAKAVDAAIGYETSGAETVATAEEKKMIGVLDFTEIKVLRRDNDGKVMSFEIVTDINDPIDSDNDGIPDKKEKSLGTDAEKMDTDGDGISDYQELLLGTDPKIKNDFNKK